MTKRERLIIYPVLFIIAVLFLLAFSLWESPLYPHWYGCDASFFSMAGRGITKGWVPYLDFFDLKGPYFFFLQALGQFVKQLLIHRQLPPAFRSRQRQVETQLIICMTLLKENPQILQI